MILFVSKNLLENLLIYLRVIIPFFVVFHNLVFLDVFKVMLATMFLKVFKTIVEINFKSKLLKLFIENCFVSSQGSSNHSIRTISVYVAVHSKNEISYNTDITVEQLEQLKM